MDNYSVDDKFLYKHMKSTENIILDNLPKEEDLSHCFSKKFERKMKKLLKEEKRSPSVNRFAHYGRKVAMIFLIVITVLFATTMSIEALRERFLEKTVKIFRDRTSISYYVDDEIGKGLMPKIPTYIPEGFILDDQYLSTSQNMNIYKNKEGTEITYHQSIAAGSSVILDTEGVEVKYININNQKVMSYTNKGFNNLYWDDDIYMYFFHSSIDMDELIKMAESLRENK